MLGASQAGFFSVETEAIKASEMPDARKDKPAKLAQKDRDARWTVNYSKVKQPTQTPTSAPTKTHGIAISMFGYENHAGIDRAHGFIRGSTVRSASAHDGTQLRNVITRDNTASTVWADSACRSKSNEEWPEVRQSPEDVEGPPHARRHVESQWWTIRHQVCRRACVRRKPTVKAALRG